jgi:hypothetical protein
MEQSPVKGPKDKVLEHLYTWATKRLPIPESKLIVEEIFLWGFQTAQILNGVPANSPQFTIDAGMLLNKRWTKTYGWHIKLRDGSYRDLLYKDKNLKPVIKRRKRRKLRSPRSPFKGESQKGFAP